MKTLKREKFWEFQNKKNFKSDLNLNISHAYKGKKIDVHNFFRAKKDVR